MSDIFEKDPVILSSVQCFWLNRVPAVWVSQPLFAQLHVAGVRRLLPLWLNSTVFLWGGRCRALGYEHIDEVDGSLTLLLSSGRK